jgi:sec-independent protein translocase protein TatA
MDIGPGELLIVLVIVIILFGPGRLANIGGELGKAIHNFREGLKSAEGLDAPEAPKTAEGSTGETPKETV